MYKTIQLFENKEKMCHVIR